jgi:outer membrane protein TolC
MKTANTFLWLLVFASLGLLLEGCRGVATNGERQARADARAVGESYRPRGQRPALPELTAQSGLDDYLRFAMLNQPQVEAAYFAWLGSVERITQERSLPDPRLTFEMYIQDMVTSVMPGLMMDFPGPGKLAVRARVASAESEGKYFTFETSALQTAFALKKSFYQLYFLDQKIRVNRQTLDLLADLEKLARAQNEVGKVTLQDVLRAQIEQDRLKTELANLEDSRHSLLTQFKAALGLRPADAAPPVPQRLESTPLDLTSEKLVETALARNPRLKVMAAEVRRAEAALALAHKSRVPDFSAGLEVDVKPSPAIYNPQFSVTLPIWRDKIAAEIAEAQAGKRAAEARLSAEEITLAVDFAEKSFMYREASRNLALLQDQLLPKQRQSLEVARSGYLAGQIDFFNLTDAEQTLLRFALAEVEAGTQRELALAELSLLIVGVPPPGAPFRPAPAELSRHQHPSSKK